MHHWFQSNTHLRTAKSLFAISIILIAVTSLKAEELRYENHVYNEEIKSVILRTNKDFYDPIAIANLKSINSLVLEFDYMQADQEFFQFQFIHCSAQWEPSDLQVTEYLEGITMGEIRTYEFSTNTLKQYVHYTLKFPDNEMKLIKSGNYLLKVFRNFDEEDLVITRRFMLLDSRTKSSGSVRGSTNPKTRFQNQEVDFEVNYENYQIPNPFTDVSGVILQNNNWTTAKYNLKPLFVNSNNLIFNYEDVNVFDGNNEFRFFDIRSLRFFSNQVAEKFTDSVVNTVLRKEENKGHVTYSFQKDFNGKRIFDNKDGSADQLDLDYSLVHFTLVANNKINVGDVYIYGELTDWKILPEFKMNYMEGRGFYTQSVLLKQGYYNYHYVVAKEGSDQPEYAFTEGNHFETENDYTVLVYHHNMYYNYDELIGVLRLNSSGIQR